LTYYSFLLGIGALVGLLRLARVTPRERRNSWLLVGWMIYLGALLGARLGYAFEHVAYFRQHLSQALAFWTGGFTWQGGVIGALLALVLVSRWSGRPWRLMLDITAIMLLPVAVTLWLGAWTEGLAYGAAAPAGAWWALPSADVYGEAAARVPVQFLAALGLLLVLGAAEGLTLKAKHSGIRGSLIWLVFSLLMLVFTLLRVDPAPVLLGVRVETWFAILFSSIFIFLTLGLYFASAPNLAKPVTRAPGEWMKDEQV